MDKQIKILFLLALSGLFFILLFVDTESYENTRLRNELWNLGHIACFFVWTFLLISISKRFNAKTFYQQSIFLVVSIFVVAFVIEAIQYFIGRMASMEDVLFSLIGGFLVITFFSEQRKSINHALLRLYQASIIAILLLSTFTVSKIMVDEVVAYIQFPVLSSLESPFESSRWDAIESFVSVVEEDSMQNRVLKIRLTNKTYSGVSLSYMNPDWQAYKWLKFKIYHLENESISISVSIQDKLHELLGSRYEDRFTKDIILNAGLNSIAIPLDEIRSAPKGREMDLADISKLIIVVKNVKKRSTIYLDDVLLE